VETTAGDVETTEKTNGYPVSSGLKEFWRTASSVLFVRSGPYFALLIAAQVPGLSEVKLLTFAEATK
jgi:hypothetical protein